jgi:hypothetical protein
VEEDEEEDDEEEDGGEPGRLCFAPTLRWQSIAPPAPKSLLPREPAQLAPFLPVFIKMEKEKEYHQRKYHLKKNILST